MNQPTENILNDAGESTSESIHDTLTQRGDRYGDFEHHASLSQALSQTLIKHYFEHHANPAPLQPFQTEALQMICHKLARIVNGDPSYDDNWRDIAGYAQLVVDILQKESK